MNSQVALICKTCNRTYNVQYYRRNLSKFCSKKCMNDRIISEETRLKMSKAKIENPTNYWAGKQRSDETKDKLRKANIGKIQSKETIRKRTEKITGHLSPNWKGGIAKIDKKVRRIKEYLLWRDSVFKRDNFTCQKCDFKGYVTAHHIKAFSQILKEYNIKTQDEARRCEELWDINNGITLCETCHEKTDNYKGRRSK